MRYKLVIFDFDGTLADSASWFASQLPDLARAHGFQAPSAEQIECLRKLSTREIISALGVPPLRLPAIAADLKRRAAADAQKIKLFEGIPELLEALRGLRVRTAVVSSNSEANVRQILGCHASQISAFNCGASLFGKASRFRKVLAGFELEPAEACGVGDEVRDIKAARKAGLAAVAVSWGYNRPEALHREKPDEFIQRPRELLDLVRG